MAITKKKKPQIHFSGIDRTGIKWKVTEQQKAAVRASSAILGGTSIQQPTKKVKRKA